MNKSLKVVSSVALAGMLAINVLNPITLAKSVDDRYDTRLAGTYKGMAQFVLANKNDYVTYREIANSDKFTNVESFKGAGVPSNDNELVQTGDKFVADGKEYTVVVYGEVDKNSDRLTQDDALKILKHFTGSSKMTNAAELEAANVDRTNDRITQDDALQVLKYFTGSSSTLIKGNLPHDGEEVVEEDTNFSIELSDGSAYFNNTNTSNSSFKIKVATPVNKTNLTIKVEGKKADGTDITPITSSSSSMTTSLNDITMSITGDLSSVVGNVKVTLLEGTKVLRIANIENKTADTSIANIKTNRLNSTEATISFEGMGKYDVKNVYYTIAQGTTNGTNPTIESEKIIVTGNKVTNKALKGLNAAGAHDKYTVNMLVEDIYGNISSDNATSKYATATVLTEEEQANQQDKVNVTLDKNITNVIHFDVKKLDGTTNNDQDLKYVLYKDGKIIKEADVTSNQEEIEISSSDLEGVGTYKISVVAKGVANTSSDSEATEATFEVKQLNPVSNITLAKTDDDKFKINWTKSTEEGATNYEIAIYAIDENGNISNTATETISVASVNTIEDISKSISTKDKAYVAKIITKATNNVYYVDSEEKTSNQIVVVNSSSLSLGTSVTTSNSITFTPTGMKNIPGVTSTYILKVYNDNGANLGLATRYTPLKEINNPINENGEIVVDGLQAGTAYGFDLIETIGNVENITSTISGSILSVATKAQAPVVNGLTVATYEAGKVASDYVGKIALDSVNSNLYINGSVYGTSAGDYATEAAKIAGIVGALKSGDIITINEDVVTLDLVNATKARSFGTALDGKTVIVNCGTKVEKSLTATAPTKVTLQGNGALYDVTNVGGEIEVDKNVANIVATTTQKVTLLSNASTTINNVKVSTKAGATVVVNSGDVTVHVDTSKTDSELSFENNGDITFTTTDTTNKTTLNGTVKINTPEAVTITSSGVAIDSTIDVISAAKVTNEVAKNIDLTNTTGLNGTKVVTVNKGAKTVVKFVAKTAINKMDNTALTTIPSIKLTSKPDSTELSNWATLGLISSAVNGEYNQTEVNAVIAQLNNIYASVMDKGATLSVATANNVTTTTITFDGSAIASATLNNIK